MDQRISRFVAAAIRIRRSWKLATATALGIFLLALLFRLVASEVLVSPYPFLTFFPAVGFAAFFGGFVMGLVVLALSVGAAFLFFIPEVGQSNLVGLAYFTIFACAECLVIGFFNKALDQNLLLIERLHAAIERAKAATATKTRMMASISHDLKQPLQTIVGTLDTLASRATGDADAALIARALRAVSQQSRALDNLLEASRLELGQRKPNPQRFPLMDALREIAEECGPLAERKRLRFRSVRCSGTIVTDYEMLMTILRNLTGNAIKYTSSGGVLIGARRRGNEFRIDVVDTGVGIARDKLDRVFEEFYQASENSDGVGLGLAIVHETCGLLGCRIKAESRPGRGTRFSVFMPRGNGVGDQQSWPASR